MELTHDIGPYSPVVDIDENTNLLVGDWIEVDSEKMKITAMELSGLRLIVSRYQGQTAPTGHISGATVTEVTPISTGGVTVDNQVDNPAEVTTLIVPGATIAGNEADLSESGAQTTRLLGPYRVHYNTSGMTPNGAGAIVGDDLPVGALVWAWAVLIVGFNNAGTEAGVRIDFWWGHAGGVGVPGTLGETLSQIGVSGAFGEDTSTSGYPVQSGSFVTPGRLPQPYRVISTGVKLAVKLNGTDPGVPTTGTVDVYALISEPAT